jgi:hypothetical protein
MSGVVPYTNKELSDLSYLLKTSSDINLKFKNLTPVNAIELLRILKLFNCELNNSLDNFLKYGKNIESYVNLFQTYHGIKYFCMHSYPLEYLSNANLYDVIQSDIFSNLKNIIMHSVGYVETISNLLILNQRYECQTLKSFDNYFVRLINSLSGFSDTYKACPLHSEALIQIKDEIISSEINSESIAMIVGSGPLPLSAIAYSMYAKHVFLVDVSKEAIDASNIFISMCLPEKINNFTFLNMDACSIDFNKFNLTHLLLTGMLPVKDEILAKLNNVEYEYKLRCIVRESKKDLMLLFNYPISVDVTKMDHVSSIRNIATQKGSWSDLLIVDFNAN